MTNRTLTLTPEIYAYIQQIGFREPPVLTHLREALRDHPQQNMQIAPEQGALMQLLVAIAGIRRGIEIGTFTGYSALAVALAMPHDGRLVCCDISEEWTTIAKHYWREAGVEQKIDLRIAPALKTLDELSASGQSFDWVFIDADKGNYTNYYNKAVELLCPGGLILIDNALWSGHVVNPADDDARAIDACNRLVFNDERVEMVLLPLADGLLLARKT